MTSYRKIFPPILPSFLPAIDSTVNTVRVYFNISPVNTIYEIAKINIFINDVNENKAQLVLQNVDFNMNNYDSNKEMYFADINITNMNKNKIDYKIQLQFISINNTISEFSNICLMKIINSAPVINIISNQNISEGYYKAKASYSHSSETLKYYKFSLYKNNILIEESEKLFYKGSIEYIFNHYFKFGNKYKIKLYIETYNQYIKEQEYIINVTTGATVGNFVTLDENNKDKGVIVFNINKNNVNVFINEQYYSTINSGKFNFSYFDSGIAHKYDFIDDNNSITSFNIINDYEYCWIIDKDNTLMVDYNMNISNINLNTKNIIVETFSNYPVFYKIKNGFYKSFQFNSILTYNGNENFINDLITAPDYVKEREFRKRIMQFLTNGKVKVFKSGTEGLILCMLTDIALVPKNELSRIIYDISFTVTEIDEFNYKNLRKYNLV